MNNSSLGTVPIVPPEDPDKDPDVVDPLPPLPLPEESEGKEVLILYEFEGEDAQDVLALADTDPGVTADYDSDQTGVPSASIDSVMPGAFPGDGTVDEDEIIEFVGNAGDNDFEGDPGIVAYEWRSNVDGLLSSQDTFTITASSLVIGDHTISLRAQDNEGNWSDWDEVPIEILERSEFTSTLYLPVIFKDN